MTIAEINRALESKKRQLENEEKRKASFDYILADLIGCSISRIYSSSSKMPTLAQAYPSLFSGEELEKQRQQKLQELSAIRFRQFAQAFNKNIGGAKVTDG